MHKLDAVVGFSVNLEETLRVTAQHPVKCEVEASDIAVAGTSFNVALALLNAGCTNLRLLGTAGNDDRLILLKLKLEQSKLDYRLFPVRQGTPKTVSVIWPDHRQQLLRSKPPYLDHDFGAEKAEIHRHLDEDPRLVIATGVRREDMELAWALFREGPLASSTPFRVLAPSIELCADLPLNILFQECELLALNNFEAEAMLGMNDLKFQLEELGKLGCRVLLTWNSHGVYYFDGSCWIHQLAFPVEVIDETGAGDCLLAYFLAGHMLQGIEVHAALGRATMAAALKVGRLGSSNMPTLVEVEEFIRKHQQRPAAVSATGAFSGLPFPAVSSP